MHPATTAASPPIIIENTANVSPAYFPPDCCTTFIAHPPVVGLLPGSRRGEAQHNFPPMLEVARRIREAFPRVRFLVPTTADPAELARTREALGI